VNVLHSLLKVATIPYGVFFRERRPGLIILGYHRIGGRTGSDIDLPAAEFTWQMTYLRKHYTLVSMDAIVNRSVREDLSTRADVVAVTFDDGFREIYDVAFPVLREHGIPATVYLATRYVDKQEPFDFGGYARPGVRPQPLSWAQMREMIDTGLITAGAHTHGHPDLTRLPAGRVREELGRSRQLIADRLGVTPQHFAYPWGKVTPSVRRIVGEYFRTAVRGGCGKNPFGTCDPLALWRRPIQQSDASWLFRLKLKSYLDGEEYVRTLAARLRRPGVQGEPA
jgi:peptidoglycan/xylan/chitin deacetylase (PgdA/CDA1 family)